MHLPSYCPTTCHLDYKAANDGQKTSSLFALKSPKVAKLTGCRHDDLYHGFNGHKYVIMMSFTTASSIIRSTTRIICTLAFMNTVHSINLRVCDHDGLCHDLHFTDTSHVIMSPCTMASSATRSTAMTTCTPASISVQFSNIN